MTIFKITSRPRKKLAIVPRDRMILSLQEKGIAIGVPGFSAYEIWLSHGNIGTEQDFLDSLVGPPGFEEPIFMASEASLLEPGDKARIDAAVTYSEGDRYSSTDAGTINQISISDDYLYICVKTGTAGNAIWKKTPLFKS
jgi:hypothetical protein